MAFTWIHLNNRWLLGIYLLIPNLLFAQSLSLTLLSQYNTGNGSGAAEIVAYDSSTKQLYLVNNKGSFEIVSLANPAMPQPVRTVDLTSFGAAANSIAVKNGVVAVAIEATTKQNPGVVAFFNLAGDYLNQQMTVGALPDMLTFTPDGRYLLVANEGEPNDSYNNDPEGSISIIHLQAGIANATVTTASFAAFNSQKAQLLSAGIRIFGPNATVAQDLEPEYIAVTPDSQTAYVSLQENNALAVIDIATATVTQILLLGFKNHQLAGNGLDPSDKDSANNGGINIAQWPVMGIYQPDTIAVYPTNNLNYIVTANEGDSRDYKGFTEEARVKSLKLDPTAFPNAATLQQDSQLGRLTVTNTLGDPDQDGDFDQLYSFGARSFSIWNAQTGALIFDSGDQFEQRIAAQTPALFNQDGPGKFDQRSDNKGPEPEALDLGTLGGRTFAFIGLERVGGIMAYDITEPAQAQFMSFTPPATGDNAPESVKFIRSTDTNRYQAGQPLLVVANEVSGTVTIYQVEPCVLSNLYFMQNQQLAIIGSCVNGGFDIWQEFEGQLTRVASNITVDEQTRITLNSDLQGRFFAALPGQNTPINNLYAYAIQPVPALSPLALSLLSGWLLIAGLLWKKLERITTRQLCKTKP